MIRRILLLFFLLNMFCIKFVYSDEAGKYSNISNGLTYYYKNKDVNTALDLVQQISDSKMLEHNQHGYASTIGFILGIMGENKEAIEKFHNLTASSVVQECISTAENLLEQYSFEVILSDPDKIQDESSLDLLWGVFFATGNSKIPETIRSFVEKNKISEAPVGKKGRKDIVVMVAIWSLESNAKQHEIVVPYAEFPVQLDNMGKQNIITFYKEARQKKK